MNKTIGILISLFLIPLNVIAGKQVAATTEPVPVSQISTFSTYSATVKNLILTATKLSQMNLTYLYGSADPKNKGMDCSGTIYYLLNQISLHDVPRQSDEIYAWVEKKGKLYHVNGNDFQSKEFSYLKPGDLLFWSGTYAVSRALPITHVMLYLGKNKEGEPIMFGASDGRTYHGKKMWGVSVFDFILPDGNGPQKFVGYGCIPGLTCVDSK